MARGQTWEAGVVSETQHGTQEDLAVKHAKNQGCAERLLSVMCGGESKEYGWAMCQDQLEFLGEEFK